MPTIRLTHIDGKLPNIALMKLAHWHRAQGHQVHLARHIQPDLFEPAYDLVYASAIFRWSEPMLADLRNAFPEAFVGGTGTVETHTVEEIIGESEYEHYDYAIYPEYHWSLGFTQRGCRLRCSFCVVPQKEGRPRPINRVSDIWQPDRPRALVLLDNDFFGQPETEWQARIEELVDGDFKVSFNQGINLRILKDEQAMALARVRYYDMNFTHRRLYTAWDNLGDERIFFRGLDRLEDAGIPARHVMVYMLIGYDPEETWEKIIYRYQLVKDTGCLPYPMVYDNKRKDLKRFQRWVVRRFDEVVAWEKYAG